MRSTQQFIAELRQCVQGDILDDFTSKMLYATDASLYQIVPLAIARPRSLEDCIAIVKLASEYQIPIIPRAAGTSLGGQAVGKGLVVDMSHYLTRILNINTEEKYATVEAGVVLHQLNVNVRAHGLMFAPDPSTLNRCTISGVIGNNAWGAHALKYGTTRENVISAEVVLANSQCISISPLTKNQLAEKKSATNFEAQIYQGVFDVLDPAIDHILAHYPSQATVPCNTGYGLRYLAESELWQAHGPPFSLLPLVCGSEGTLGLITTAKVRLVPIPRFRNLICLHVAHLHEALEAAIYAVKAGAAAVELLDEYILRLARQNILQKKHTHWLEGNPNAVLLIEFCGDDESSIRGSTLQIRELLMKKKIGYAYPIFEGALLEEAWALRRAGLGLLMGVDTSIKPVTFIEDSAVPLNALVEFVSQVQGLMAFHNVNCVYYGSVGMGLIHLRPLLNLNLQLHRNLLSVIGESVADLLRLHGGCISAKHGDGRIRSGFISPMLGQKMYNLMSNIKNVFDPKGLFNPKIIIDTEHITSNLRIDVEPTTKTFFSTGYEWNEEQSFLEAVGRCKGAGACRKAAGDGIMCPSYMATAEEKHSTRGRANVYRQIVQSRGVKDGIVDHALHEVLDLCVSCKGCKAECPANVDMSKLKAEHLYHYYKRYGVPLRARFVTRFVELARFASYFPRPANYLSNSTWLKKILNLHEKRSLPQLATESLHSWYRKQPQENNKNTVVIFSDAFTSYYEVKIGIAAISVLRMMGYKVVLSPCFPSLRTAISQGQLDLARSRLQVIEQWLTPYINEGVPIIGLEPSEILTFRDEALNLSKDFSLKDRVLKIANYAVLFEEFLTNNIEVINKFPQQKIFNELWFHGHCHQKSLSDIHSTIVTLQNIFSCEVKNLATGCCGMAGVFGYEKEHYEVSMAMGNLVLFPALEKAHPNIAIIAAGASCREQIRHGTNKNSFHPAELLWKKLSADKKN